MVVNRFDVSLTNLDPIVGSEIQKVRLFKHLGTLDSETQLQVISVLQRLFAF
jgi:mRNA-degrading endonuclease toxin of MazEF toxin-antitoxin module